MSLSAFRKGAIGGAALGVMIIAGLVMNQGQMVPSQGIFVSGTPSAGEFPQWDGAQWQGRVANDYRSKHSEYADDFLSNANTDWIQSAVSGAGATAISGQGTTTRPGIIEIKTGTTTTGQARWNGANTDELDLASYSSVLFEVVGGWPILSTVAGVSDGAD